MDNNRTNQEHEQRKSRQILDSRWLEPGKTVMMSMLIILDYLDNDDGDDACKQKMLMI